MMYTKSIYKRLADVTKKGAIKPEVAGIYITPDGVFVTDSFRAVMVDMPHADVTHTIYVPAAFAKKYMTGEVVPTDAGLRMGNAWAQEVMPWPALPGGWTQANVDATYEKMHGYCVGMVRTESTGTMPYVNAGYLAGVLDIIARHDDHTKNNNGVRIYHAEDADAAVTIKGERITALLMPMRD